MNGYVLGVDIGGSGSRVALGSVDDLGRATADATVTGPRIGVGAGGSTGMRVAHELIASAADAWPDHFGEILSIGIGSTGIASVAEDPAPALDALRMRLGIPVVAAIDAVTAHLGALGGRGGAITALGTGAIALAHSGPDAQGTWAPEWTRSDGWGHLFGDRGGGAWLGRRALAHALRAHDGVDPSGQALLTAAARRFGPPATWPAQFYTREDRAGLLAEFAVDIAAVARDGDRSASELLRDAGREAARSAISAARARFPGAPGATPDLPNGDHLSVALTGGLVRAGSLLIDGFREEIERLDPDARILDAAGDPLDGSLHLAAFGAAERIRAQTGVVWTCG